MRTLTQSLEYAPRPRQAQKRLIRIENEDLIEVSTFYDGQDNVAYTGHYGDIQISNCHGVELHDLVAQSIELLGSEVSMENVKIKSPGTGLQVTNSVLTATLLQIEADTGMVVDTSYLDLAGADFVTADELVEIQQDARLYFSLCRSLQGGEENDLHGVSIGAEFNLH